LLINGLTKNAALEYSKQGIRVNSICPGGIETRMLDSLATQASKGRVSTHEMMDPLHPIGRIGMPNEVAELIVFSARRAPLSLPEPTSQSTVVT
jgi:NAD(P)-dependent dehydrogenase (short-subunit alcohol dehydrogenase family)